MEGEEGSGIRLSKRFAGGKVTGGSLEVDYKTKAGTAWSHNFLNQKPWHPLSYPNQRRKWIAEQTHAQRERRSEEVAREFAQEQEFFRQTALISKKEREKIEMMKAVSFMYVRPPGYDAESAKAAELADQNTSIQDPTSEGTLGAKAAESAPGNDRAGQEKKKPRPKDVFGRSIPTEEEFEILKNAPRLETGMPGRVKPFAVEVRNVKCLRCGNYGHQSGDRECPLKDAIMPNEEVRLKRDDPLTAITALVDPSEPLKWELKQKPGLSPPRGGFNPDDPNQQIVAEDIYDEYGGFLGDGIIPIELLANITSEKKRKFRKNKKHKKHSSRNVTDSDESSTDSEDGERRRSRKSKKHKKNKKKKRSKKHDDSDSYFSADSASDSHRCRRKHKHLDKSETHPQGTSSRRKHSYSSEEEYEKHRKQEKNADKPSISSDDSDSPRDHRDRKQRLRSSCGLEDDNDSSHRTRKHRHNEVSDDLVSEKHRMDERRHKCDDLEPQKRQKVEKRQKYDDPEPERWCHRRDKGKQKRSYASEDSESDAHQRDGYRRSKKNKYGHSHSPEDSDSNPRSFKTNHKFEDCESDRYRSRRRRSRSQ